MNEPPENLKAALRYLQKGWSVIPCDGKKPRINWVKYQHQLPDAEEVVRWWKEWPDSNVGIITGKVSGIVAADVDVGRGGVASRLPITGYISRTGGGGSHHIYVYPGKHVPNKVAREDDAGTPLEGVDIRGDGGFIVAPPSTHSSGGYYHWIQQDFIAEFPYEFFFPEKEQPRKSEDKWLTDLFSKSIPQGQRNDTVARIAGYYASKGLPVDVAILHINQLMARQDDPLPESEIDVTTRSVYRTHQRSKKKEGGEKDDFRLLTLNDYMLEYGDTEVEWMVSEWLPDKTIAFVVSPPGSYKTWLLFDLAISVATGENFLGKYHVQKPGPVVIIQQEDFHGQIAERLATIYKSRLNLDITFSDDEIVFKSPTAPPIYIYPDRNFRFASEGMVGLLEKQIERLRPQLVLIDPLYSTTSTDEYMLKAVDEMFVLKKFRDKYGTSFVIVSHTNKNSKDSFDRQGLWGSQFLNAFLETGWQTRKVENKPEVIVHRHFKMAGTAPPIKLTFDIQTTYPSKYEVTTEVISPAESELGRKASSLEDQVLEVIATAHEISKSKISDVLCKPAYQISRLLKKLETEGEIEKASSGGYIIAKVPCF